MKQRCDHRPIKGQTLLTCSDAPDTTKQQEAAMMTAQLSKEQLDWAKQIYSETAPARARAEERATRVSDAQLADMETARGMAKDYADYNKNTFRPLEQGIVADAQAYDTPQRREAAAAGASADAEIGLAGQRAATSRELERSGVAPGSGKSLALGGMMDLGAAKLKAGAANKARMNIETIGAAKKMDAASLGRGLPGNQATSASLAMAQGNSAAQNAGAALLPSQNAQIGLSNAYGGARAGYGSAANIYGDITRTQAGVDASNTSNVASGVGAIAGAAALMF